ncbi:M48 family metallopeptidase [Helicobacter kayseriensis]|uniref:M48 family metallopeptidase n=1 Tax=Helicobacter kayseriensis TaxID=2905877 RepID=UPI001E4CB51D|nr:M48 family metallopeptidase [Helicobacter kayseriensis]MCE3047443.1 M48 family metallopeptidase [Helicobacter kayseriensis]MCE3048824.1 M48 family metallopeptidase [Helicobacter kayseriensis]
MNYELITFYLICFVIPNLFLNILQYRHIQKTMQFDAVLLSPKDYLEAGHYALAKLRLSIFQDLFGFAFFVFWILYGLKWLNLVDFFAHGFGNQVLIVLGLLVFMQIFHLPFKYWQEMVIDKQYGFSHQTIKLFLMDFVRGMSLLVVAGSLVLYGLVLLIHYLQTWWLWCAVFVFATVLMINFLYPTWIAPLFNTFTPLQDSLLQEKIEGLMKSVGFQSSGIFVMDASKRDGRLNAYFGGFGKNKRVVLFDTLLEKISSEGLIAILGHELGHFKHKDLVFGIVVQGVFLFCIFYLLGSLPQSLFEGLGLSQTPANLLMLLLLMMPLIAFWFLPFVGFFSRKAEYRADAFGASLSSKKALAQALVRLVEKNKSFPHSHPLYICFHYTHPPLLERLKALDYEISR